jgi:hypothetical protein
MLQWRMLCLQHCVTIPACIANWATVAVNAAGTNMKLTCLGDVHRPVCSLSGCW